MENIKLSINYINHDNRNRDEIINSDIKNNNIKNSSIKNNSIKNSNIIIRKETPEDYTKTEYMVMRAFWNQHGPGCNEHLLVHKLRDSEAYLPDCSRVAELDGQIVGVIMYSKAWVRNDKEEFEITSFGPLCVEPTLHNMGIGRKLLKETLPLVKEAGYAGICIFGEPEYYPKLGFRTADNYGITDAEGNNYDALMAYALDEEAFAKVNGRLYEAEVFENCEDETEIRDFTKNFPYHKPLKLSCQWLHEERLGRICQVQKNIYKIRFFEKEIFARLKGRYAGEYPVVGDYVTFIYNPQGESVITSLCERKSLLKRPKNLKEQVMVSNFDYVFIVSSLNENYNYNRIARYVSIALQGGGTPVVILTKADLCSNPGRYVREIEGLSEQVRVHTISALYGIGLDELKEYMIPGKTIAILGSSGAGKSTLVNALAGQNIMETGAIRDYDDKGRHTTTHRELIELENGVTLIDTPGMRELGMGDVSDGINGTFSDIAELAAKCRFRDCRHDTEPGCAVKAALKDGALSIERFELYKSLQSENDNRARMKAISKARKQIKNRR